MTFSKIFIRGRSCCGISWLFIVGRYNKLGLNADGDDGRVSEVHKFTRVVTEPLGRLQIVSAALGHTHSAVVTGKLSF